MLNFSIINTQIGFWQHELLNLALDQEKYFDMESNPIKIPEYDVYESIILHTILSYGYHIMGLAIDEELAESN